MAEETTEGDYDEINEKSFSRYLNVSRKAPKTEEEALNMKISYYLKSELNFYETGDRS